MNILVLIPDLKYPGGVTNYYKCLRLDKEKYIRYMNVNTIATDPDIRSNISKKASFFIKISYLPLIYLKFIYLILNHQIIHINPSLNFKSFFRDMGFIIISRLMGKKIILFFRGWEDEFESKIKNTKLYSTLFNYTYSNADCYIVLGQLFKNKLIGLGVNENKQFYIETTIADSEYLKYFDIDNKIKSISGGVNLLFISRILRSKGIYIAIEAFVECEKAVQNKKIKLYIAGDGEELENAKQYVAENNYRNIIFLGYATNELKKDILMKCHIMIFPTYYGEGLPNCVLEGMLYGMPIISRIVGGIPDVVEHGVNGYLNTSLDSQKYAQYCVRLIENNELYSEISRVNHAKASKFYTTESVRIRLLSIYNKLIDANKTCESRN